jgi:hypothetical protein
MQKNKVIGILLLVLSISTLTGLALNNDKFWVIYNYIVIIFGIIGGFVLLKQK